MLKNINYNLIQTISSISTSIFRYDTYLKDAAGCANCEELWKKLKEEREKELSTLRKELKKHIDAGTLPLE